MRRSAVDKIETKKKIVMTAAREFLTNGENVGIAEIMNAAELTHGGFYRHFGSKDELFSTSIVFAIQKLLDRIEQALKKSDDSPLEIIINTYLSTSHKENPAVGCPFACLGSELARAPKAIRAEFAESYSRFIRIIADSIPKANAEERRADAEFILATMAGVLIISRIMCDKRASDEMLKDAARRLVLTYSSPVRSV